MEAGSIISGHRLSITCGKFYGIFTTGLSIYMKEEVNDTDLELVRRFLQTKEQSCFERLIARHRNWIFHTCERFLHSDDQARDATQEVFTRCLEKLHTFEGANLPGWLKAIAVNTCLNIIEKQKRWAVLEDEDERSNGATVET